MSVRASLRATPVLLAALIAGALSARAMNIRTSKTEIARATDGAILFEVREDGPEGGGSLAYQIQGKAARDVAVFVLSSDFGPGDGSRVEAIPPEACRRRLEDLGAELVKRKFTGITLRPERCRSARRAGLVAKK
ncbi:MAG TPA: hypothetical protein VN903_12615 [Polyangia bacterium]|jgi:hypothetical protein|nr:hypothetical protein [Polyangia bacterium]